MGGGKGGSTGTSTQYSGVQIPPEVLDRYKTATNRAEDVSKQSWQNYGGEFVAPINATQQGGYNQMVGGQAYTDAGWNYGTQQLNTGLNQAQPWLNQAGNSINTGQVQGQQLGMAGLGQAAQAFNWATPWNGAAADQYSNAYQGAQPYQAGATGTALAGMGQLNAGNMGIEGFLNPYQQQVTDATMAQLNQQQAQQRNDQRGSMIREGTFGGDRSGIANANLVNQQNMATGSVLSGLNQANYNQALAAGMRTSEGNRAAYQQGTGQLLGIGQQGYQQGMGLGTAQQGLGQQIYNQGMGQANYTGQMGQQLAGQGFAAGQAQQGLGAANYGMWGDAAAKTSAMAGQAFNQNMQQAQGMMGFGSLQQQTQQAQDSALYNQWMQERGYPFQTSQFYTNAVMGTGPLSGSSAYSGGFTPQPFFSDERLKENMEPIGATHDGQTIYRYNFKGQPGATQIGLSAQEVERKHPEAVTEHDGAKAVAYGPATDDAAGRPHKADGGPLGGDPFAYQPPNTLPPGVGVLGTPPTITQATGGNIGDIVATQRAMLKANAPGSAGPPSNAGTAEALGASQGAANARTAAAGPMAGMGAPAPSGGPPGAAPGAVVPGLAPAPQVFANFDGGSANGATGAAGAGSSEGGTAGSVGASVGGNTGTDSGQGSGPGELATGGAVGLARAGFAKGGDASSYSGGFGSLDNILANQQAMYGSVPWAGKGAAGVGNAGITSGGILGDIQSIKPAAVLKPPESKTPAAAKGVVDETTLGKTLSAGKDVGKAYDAGKDALFGSKAKGKPGDKDYEPETGGLFGRGGDSSRYGWLDSRDNTSEASGIDAEIKDWSKYARGGAAGLGRARFEDGGETEDIDAPFGDTSVLPGIKPAEASKAPEPPDPKGGEKGGGGGKGKDQTASAAMKLAGLGASFIPGIGSVAGPLLSIGSSFVKDGGRIPRPGFADAGEVVEDEIEKIRLARQVARDKAANEAALGAATTAPTEDEARGSVADALAPPKEATLPGINPERPAERDQKPITGLGGISKFDRPEPTLPGGTPPPYAQPFTGLRNEPDTTRAPVTPPPTGLGAADDTVTPRGGSPSEPSMQPGFAPAVAAVQPTTASGAPVDPNAKPPPAVTGAPAAPPPTPSVTTQATPPALGGASTNPPAAPPATPPVQRGQVDVLTNIKNRESGNSHWGADGRPKQGAAGESGVGQFMPGTAIIAAKQAGVPWNPELFYRKKTGDPVKDKEAEDYNRLLMDAHFNALKNTFGGDEAKAAAAYNCGQACVETAVKNHGADWMRHIPNSTQAYVIAVTGQGGGAMTVTDGRQQTGLGASKTGDDKAPAAADASGLGGANGEAMGLWGKARNWVERNDTWLAPLLSGIGGMLSSPSRTLAGSIGSGMVAGAQQYGTLGQRQQDLDIKRGQLTINERTQLIGVLATLRGMQKARIDGRLPPDPQLDAQIANIAAKVAGGGFGAAPVGPGAGGYTPTGGTTTAPGGGTTTAPGGGTTTAPAPAPTQTPAPSKPGDPYAMPELRTGDPAFRASLRDDHNPDVLREQAKQQANLGFDPKPLFDRADMIEQQMHNEGWAIRKDGQKIEVPGWAERKQATANIEPNRTYRDQQTAAAQVRAQARTKLEGIRELLTEYESGRFADIKGDLIAKARAVGIQIPDTAMASPEAFAIFMKDAFGGVMDALPQNGQTNQLRTEAQHAFANPNMPPAANRKVVAQALGLMDFMDKRYNDEQKMLETYPHLDRGKYWNEWSGKKENNAQQHIDEAYKNTPVRGEADSIKNAADLKEGHQYIFTPQNMFDLFGTGRTKDQIREMFGGKTTMRVIVGRDSNGNIGVKRVEGKK